MRFATTTAILLLAGLVLAAPPKVVEEFSSKVIGVTDGDAEVLVNKESVTVRLEGIDAPESGQSYGKKSKEALAEIGSRRNSLPSAQHGLHSRWGYRSNSYPRHP